MKTKTAPAPLTFFLDNEDRVIANGLDVFENVADLALYLAGKDTYDANHKEAVAAMAALGIYPDTEEVEYIDEDNIDEWCEKITERASLNDRYELEDTVMELFITNLSSTVKVGVTWVTDEEGHFPNEDNNYLFTADGKSATGLATLTTGEIINFTMIEKKSGNWVVRVACKYIV